MTAGLWTFLATFHQGTQVSRPLGSQPVTDAAALFAARCATCHGADGRGAERGPDIVASASAERRPVDEIARIVRDGIPSGGMPPGAPCRGSGQRAREPRSIARRRRPRRAHVSTRQHRAARRTPPRRSRSERGDRGSPAPDAGRRSDGVVPRRDRTGRVARPRQDAGARRTRRDRPVGRRRLADLQRRCVWQPTYGTAPDHRGQRRADAVEVDRAARRRAQLTDDAGGGRRRHVCDGAERSLRARCPQRSRNLAVRSAAHPWRHWRRGRRRQSRRGGARRPPVRGDRRCEAAGAASG